MIYIPANNNICGSNMGTEVQYTPGRPFVGIGGSRPFTVPGADHFGEVQAWNVDTGQRVWTHNYQEPELGFDAGHCRRARVQRWDQ
jgi:alcohol dehydrogenase (cytochrome c)